MATLEKSRNEIDDKYKWDLSVIYKSDEDWYESFDKISSKINEIKDVKSTFLKDGKSFYKYLKLDEENERHLYKLYYYAHLNNDSDTTCDKYKVMLNKISDLITKYNELSSFVVPEILKLDEKKLNSFYKDEKKLEEYRFVIEEIYRYKKHTLDEEKELMLTSLSKCLSTPEETYESLIYSDIEFGSVKNKDGVDVKLNESNYSLLIKSDDRILRKNTFEKLFSTYSKFKNTIASCFSGNVENNVVNAKLRNYNSAIEASLYNDNVDASIYKNLIDTTSKNLDILYKYYDLKKDILNLDELHLYDVYVDLIKKYDKKYTFDEAKKLVLEGLGVLGEDYIKNLNKAFDEKWIDIYYNKGKTTGAYSSGFYDTNPYVLLNFKGTLDDVSTLAHELGHSMHTYLSCKNNPYQYSNYKIFVAEVASTVNELLLANYMLNNSKNKEEKLYVLNHIMELIKSTLYRQVMFAEFEKMMHEKREQGEILTSEFISENYYKLVKKYFGDNVVIDDLIKYEWERIPHFYYNFYVYKYSTGISAACYIVDGILNNKEGALDNYLKFLSSGGSDYPVNELKIAGVDINDPKVIESTVNYFDNCIENFKKIYEK